MFRIKLTHPADRSRLRQYSPTAMTSAYQMVKDAGIPVYRAAKLHGVPLSTLRDRVDNRISVDCVKSGPEPVLSLDEEARLCQHLKDLASVGYGYTRAEVINLASDYAVSLGKRTVDQPFTTNWFYKFLKRWPELNVIRPSSLSEQRAKCANENSVNNYFNELERILRKYNLFDKPHNIYNIDEKGINTEYRPPNIVGGRDFKAQAVMSERSKTVTIIGAGNAAGTQIPPYFVFPGIRMMDGLMEGRSPGADGVMTQTGWSNSVVFKGYLQSHFIKYCQGRDGDTILILYDGHRSHISVDLVEWAKSQNMVLFVLPPHTSHILQPMDIGCFGPLQLKYAQECAKFSRANHRVVTRYDVCSLACKAYSCALSPSNLQRSFEKAGIFPFKQACVMVEELKNQIKPSTLYDLENENMIGQSGDRCLKNVERSSEVFFEERAAGVVKKVVKQKRKNINSVVGGKALEGDTEKHMKTYLESSSKRKLPVETKNMHGKKMKTNTNANKQADRFIAKPSTSGVGKQTACQSEDFSDSEPESEIEDKDKCCHCHQFYADRDDQPFLTLTKWIQCDNASCKHWVHLKYCTPLHVARKNTQFFCNCCM